MADVKSDDRDLANSSSGDSDILLYVNGCSMTYGYELIDESKKHSCEDKAYREAHAWPGRLAAGLDRCQVINDSVPGGSNDRILRTSIRWIIDFLRAEGERGRERLLVIIGWTDPMRREYFIDGEWKQAIPYQDYPDQPEFSRLNSAYREVAWNDHESACRFATQVLAMQAFLQNYGIRFLFFDALKSCQETFAAARDDLGHLSAVDPRTYYRFNECGGSMASILASATPQWKGRHPAEDGHAYWADLLADHLVRHALLEDGALRSAIAKREPAIIRIRRFWLRFRRRSSDERQPWIYP